MCLPTSDTVRHMSLMIMSFLFNIRKQQGCNDYVTPSHLCRLLEGFIDCDRFSLSNLKYNHMTKIHNNLTQLN